MDRLRWMGWGGLAPVPTFMLMASGWLRHSLDAPSLPLVVLGTPRVWCTTAGSEVAAALCGGRGSRRLAATDRARGAA